jgi:AraC-like DNA-binding protein
LSRSDISVAEISERLAFSSQSYFTAVFKQFTGMMPTEYQTKEMWKYDKK